MSEVVIVPVHNQLHHLKKCVESLYAKSCNIKLIIVDDGSTDIETSEWIKNNAPLLGYETIRHDKAMGFSKACNDGIEYALSNYDFTCLCILNSDTFICTDDWFRKVEWYFENGNKIGIASVMSNSALAQSVWNEKAYLLNIDKKPAIYSSLLHGFCYFISKELLLKIGMLDDVLFPDYGSEDDYSMMSIEAGYNNLLVGRVYVYHHNGVSYTENQRRASQIHSIQNINKKWGKGLISRMGTKAVKVGQYLNKK